MVLRVDKARQIAGCEWTGAMGNEIDLWRRAAVEVGIFRGLPDRLRRLALNPGEGRFSTNASTK